MKINNNNHHNNNTETIKTETSKGKIIKIFKLLKGIADDFI